MISKQLTKELNPKDFLVYYDGQEVGKTLSEAYKTLGFNKVSLTQVHFHIMDEAGAGVNQIMEALHQLTLKERGPESSQLVCGSPPIKRKGVFVIPALYPYYENNILQDQMLEAVSSLCQVLFGIIDILCGFFYQLKLV